MDKYLVILLIIILIYIIIRNTRIIPFTNKPEDFRIKIEPVWSGKYICFRYSGNKGISWNTIYCASSPFLNEGWKWSMLVYRFTPSSSFEHELKYRFYSIKAIQEFESKEYERYLKGVERYNKEKQSYSEMYEKRLKEINNTNS